MTAAVASGPPQAAVEAKTVPVLRQDLRLLDGGSDISGGRRWLIYDPLQHRFIAIGRTAHVLLVLWQPNATAAEIVDQAFEQFGESLQVRDVDRFAAFLRSSGLTLTSEDGWRGYLAIADRRKSSLGSRILHTYLFFRIPLFRPEPFLHATLGLVRPLGTRAFGLIVTIVGLLGLYLVSREWEQFLTTFADVFSFQGAALLAISMVAVKLLHELGHGYVAAHLGCRVPVIGVAIVLGMPMLYCDVTDAWRLKSRRQRLRVDVAGIMVDLTVACLATFLWAFLPPGPVKSLAFSLATAGWIFSLVMNLNPFMKFDGYHIAVDACGIDNMQARAMALGRWRLREMLFGLGLPSPEPLARRVATLLTFYGWGIWLYRLIMFTGIAIAVYAFFFKLAGIALFLVEIGYFIVAPLLREIGEWIKMRKAILSSWRTAVTAGVLLALIAVVSVPWSSRVVVPAVLEVEGLAQLYPPVAAKVSAVHVVPGKTVAAGELLVSLSAPSITQDLNLTDRKFAVVELRQSRRASDNRDREAAVVLDQEFIALTQRREGLIQQLRELEIRAPAAGEVVEMAPALHVGRWINMKEPVAVLRTNASPRVRGYLDGADVWRVSNGVTARFVPDDTALPAVDAVVSSIAQASAGVLDQIELVASFGGRVADRLDGRRQPVPVAAQYALRADVRGEVVPAMLHKTVPGLLIAQGQAESFLAQMWRQSLKVLVRESGM